MSTIGALVTIGAFGLVVGFIVGSRWMAGIASKTFGAIEEGPNNVRGQVIMLERVNKALAANPTPLALQMFVVRETARLEAISSETVQRSAARPRA